MTDDPLRAEHESLQRAVASSRRAFQHEAGPFVLAMTAAMDEYRTMRQTGVSQEDACKGLEAVIRDVWPKPTTRYPPACSDCEATGWRGMVCWHEQRCGRESCARRAHPSLEHRYVVPCDCTSGERFRPRVWQPEDQLAAVGKMKPKKRGFTRMGE